MKKRFIALLLCISVTLGLFTFGDAVAVNTQAATNDFVNYGAVIGNTAEFYEYYPIPISDNPQYVTNPWNTESEFLFAEDVSGNLMMVITNYYISDKGDLWYKVEAAPGYELPSKMQEYPWVYQDNINAPFGESINVHDCGKNYIFDSDGNSVTSAEISLYDELELQCATSLKGSVEYQWEIFVEDEWVCVLGQNTSTLSVNYSLLYNALDFNNQAKIRCVTQSGSKKILGDPVTVTFKTDTSSLMYKSAKALYAADDPIQPDDDNVCYVTIQYLFDNGVQAANSFVAQVPVGVETTVNAVFPFVQGYLPYYEGVQQDSLSLTEVFNENEIYTVVYVPTLVDYTVDIYFQNVENDDYSFYDSRTYKGLTGTKVPLNTKTFEGMTELLHETPTIAADGTTHVEVYYDRIYYMTRVYLMGGFGIYSVYARYGSDLQGHLTAPTRPGYAFVGWDLYTVDSSGDGVPDTGGDNNPDIVEPTVPNRNLAYVALWKEQPTAKVNVVFWGENPNDDKYSYLNTQVMEVKPGMELTYSLTDGNVCGWEPHTHNNTCVTKCGKTVHSHDQNCYVLTCDKGHTHTDSCYGDCIHKTHGWNCYSTQSSLLAESQTGNTKTAFTNLKNRVPSPVNGTIYRARRSSTNTTNYNFFYVDDTWYYLGSGNTYRGISYSGSIGTPSYTSPATKAATLNCSHTSHSSECLSCTLGHTHSDYTGGCYTLVCTKTEHTHSVACYDCVEHTHSASCNYPKFKGYDASLWDFKESETVTVKSDGSTVLNVKFTRRKFNIDFLTSSSSTTPIYNIYEKWGADISEHWPIKGSNGVTYNSGQRWDPDGSNIYEEVLVYIAIMPPESFDLILSTSSNDTYTMHYMVEILPGENADNTRVYQGKTFKEHFTPVKANYNYLTKAEDFFDLEGFKQFGSDPAFGSNNRIDINGGGDVYFYYTRSTDNLLEFRFGNDEDEIKTEAPMYQQSLGEFGFTPPLPDEYEAESHAFAGWYLNPEYTGDPVDLNAMTMPANNLALYAKWVPLHHKVRLVKEKKEDGNYGLEDSLIEVNGEKIEELLVLHGTLVFDGQENKTPPIPQKHPYKFLGWFYMDEGIELMWDFEHHPVVTDTVIYAKWSSEVLVPYTIYYRDKNGNDIAPPTISSSLAGHSVTVKAKVGKDLFEEYREGYFPEVASHSIELNVENAETGVQYIFVYEKAESRKYYVHYVNKDTNVEFAGSPVEHSSNYAVVTETYKFYDGYVPDEYQKSLVLSADEQLNHIYFYYTEAENEGVWFVGHYIQNIDSDNKDNPDQYSAHSTNGDVDKLGNVISATWPVDLSKDGFSFYKAEISSDSTTSTVYDLNEAKGEITKKGLVIKVYYTRNKYPYKVVYRNKDTGATLGETVYTGSDMQHYGKVVSVPDDALPEFSGYEFASAGVTTIVKDGPDSVTKNIIYVYYTELSVRLDFKIVGDTGCGTVNPEYTHVKIDSDHSATATATADEKYRFIGWYRDKNCTQLITTNQQLTLLRPSTGWTPYTYYAKFEPSVGNLTIVRENARQDQVFVYAVRNVGTGEIIYVSIVGNNQITICDLPIGEYLITQQNDWSWRYNDSAQSIAHWNVDGTTVTFSGSSKTEQWLNGNSDCVKNQRG